LITLNNKLLRILQNKSYKFPVKDLYHNFDTLPIPELHTHQLYLFTNFYTINTYCPLPLPTISL